MNAARRLITGLRRGYSLAELEVAADRAMKDGVRYAYWLAQPYRRGLSDSRPTIRAYREAYATLKDLPGRARAGQFGAVNRIVQCISQTVAARLDAAPDSLMDLCTQASLAPGTFTGATPSRSAAAC